jgi:catechol 2,3-dioxygenase-like lactoylglutathione lyase family enzyme
LACSLLIISTQHWDNQGDKVWKKILHRAALGVLTDHHHIAFQAQDSAMVERFYQTALAHGDQNNGAPGERVYHPSYYAAFVLDPDGNNIEAVYHGEATRSSGSVEIRF